MLHLAVIGIVCAVSAPSEGTAFIVQKNDSNVYCHLGRGRKENVSTVPNHPFRMAVGFNLSSSDEEKIKNRTGSSFFNEFSLNQYQSNKKNSCSAIDSAPSSETKKYRNSDFRFRKKRSLSFWKTSKEIEPKTLRPPVDDRSVLCNVQNICSSKMPFKRKKCRRKGKKERGLKKKCQFCDFKNCDLNCDEKKLFFRLKSNKFKCKTCKSCKSCKRHLDGLKLDDDVDLDKRIEKLVRNVALENRKKEYSEEVTQPNQVEKSLKEKPQSGEESGFFFERIKQAFSNSRNYFRSKLAPDTVEVVQSKQNDSDKTARIKSYDILKTMRKVSRVKRNFSPRFRQPNHRHHKKRHFLHLRRKRRNMRTETDRGVPLHVPGIISRFTKKIYKEKLTEVADATVTTHKSVSGDDISSKPNERDPLEVHAPKNLPRNTLERPFLKENPTIETTTPRITLDWSEELKMRQGPRTNIKNINPYFVHFCNRKKRGCKKCSKPHRCWRTAPLLCLPYIKKAQEDQLRFLIKVLESMIGKPFPPKLEFDKIKFRPTCGSQGNSCEDSTEGKSCEPCTESTESPSCTPKTTELWLPSCPSTCPPPFPLTPVSCSSTVPPPSPTTTPPPRDICATTSKYRKVKTLNFILSRQFNENESPPVTFPVMEEYQSPTLCTSQFSKHFTPTLKETTSTTPSSIDTTTSEDSTLSYDTENEPILLEKKLFAPGLHDSFDFSEKSVLPRRGCKNQCLKDNKLSELESLLERPNVQKPHQRGESYKALRPRKYFPFNNYYELKQKRVNPKSFDTLLMEEAFRYEGNSPIDPQRVSNDEFEIPQKKFFETNDKEIPQKFFETNDKEILNENCDNDDDFDDSYDRDSIKHLLLGLSARKFSRRRMKEIKKRKTCSRHKRGDDYYSSPEKLEGYDDYEGPNNNDEHLGSLVEEDSESHTPPSFDTFFSELAKAVSESATTPSTEEEISKYLVTKATVALPVTEPSLQFLSDQKNVENTTKPLESKAFQNNDNSSSILEISQISVRLNATDCDSKVSEGPKSHTETPTAVEKQKTEMKSINESNYHINSTAAADYPLNATSQAEPDLEFEDEEMAYPDNKTDEIGERKTSFFPSKPKTTKMIELESETTERSKLSFRDDKGLDSNLDLDLAEHGQVPTTLKTAVIAKGAKRATSKPSPKVYTKIYPDSIVQESDLNETMFYVKSTTPITSEQTTPAAALNKTVDLKVQMLEVCEGYLEVIKMIRAQNLTAGDDIDLRLARYCENIISQNFNSQSEKPKKQEWSDSQSLSGTDEADDPVEDEQELSKRENLNLELNEPVTEEGIENSRNINSAETTTEEIEAVDTNNRLDLISKRMRKKRRKPKQKGKAENDEELIKRGVTDDQIKMIQLLTKRKKELMSWLLNRPNKSNFGGMQENEYFDDQNAMDQIPDDYSGPIKLRKNLKKEEAKINPLISDSEFPIYAKRFGYDKGGEVREVDIIWRKFNEKTHEKQIFKNISVLALLLTTTGVPGLQQENLKLVEENEDMSEIQQKKEERVGFILQPFDTTHRNNDTITTPTTTVATTSTETVTPTTATTTQSTTRSTVAPEVTSETTKKSKTTTTKKPSGNNTEFIITKPDSKTFVGAPPGANKTQTNATRKTHRFGTAKEIFQEYSIEFLDYAVYILPVMFTVLFLLCCLCCAVHILNEWRKHKKRKKKKKKKRYSSEELSESSETESDSDKQKSKRKGLKQHLKGKNKKFWKVLKKGEKKPDEEKSEEKKKNFLKFIKRKKEGEEDPSSPQSNSPQSSPAEKPPPSSEDDHQKEKSEANSETAERRELISLLEELKKIETEHVEEKKDMKSVQVQYMMQEDDPVFERLDLGYPYEKNVFGLPKGYSFCSKQIPYRRTNPNAVEDFEVYENMNEVTELLPCKCGYYSNDYCDCRINKKGRCERFVKIFRDTGLNRSQHFVDKNCRENEKGSFVFNKYRSINKDEGEDLLGVTQRNAGTAVRLMENSSPIPSRPEKNAGFVEEMENLKRQLNKKKNVRLKDNGVLCRL